MDATSSRTLLMIGAALLAVVGIIHLVESPEYFEKEAYIGVLFVVNAIGCAIAVYGLLRLGAPRWAWILGIVLAGGAFVAFVLSRTVGLPSFKEEEWEGLGLVSLLVEAGFVAIALRELAGAGRRAGARPRAAATGR